MTPTLRLDSIQKDLGNLIEELHGGAEFRLIHEALRLMHEEQLCSKQVQQELKEILGSAVQSSMLAVDLAQTEAKRAEEKRHRNNEGLQKISQIYF